MMIRVEHGKGNKDRYTLLGKRNLDILREYWKKYRPQDWLLCNPSRKGPLSTNAVREVLKKALRQAGIKKPALVHTLRHYAEFRIMPSSFGGYRFIRQLTPFGLGIISTLLVLQKWQGCVMVDLVQSV
jgi:integrase